MKKEVQLIIEQEA